MTQRASTNSDIAQSQQGAVPKPRKHDTNGESVPRTGCQPQPVLEPLAYRKRGAATMIGISERTIERLLAAGKFPRPDAHAGRCPLWTRESLVRWIAEGGGQI